MLWISAALAAVLAVVLLWTFPRPAGPTGTFVVVAAGKAADSLPSSTLSLRRAGGEWVAAGTVSGSVPAAPDPRQLLSVSLAAGSYDALRLGPQTMSASITITAGQVEPLLLGVGSGRVLPGAVYAGNDDVNLGLGELAGRFVAIAPFDLVDQDGRPFTPASVAGKDLIIAAFHTTCHETCPLYTAVLMQLSRRVSSSVMLAEVTTDPTVDSPAVLKRYAKTIDANWSFVTGSTANVARFWAQFGVELASGDTHTSTMALVDRHGYVRLVYRGVPDVGHQVAPPLLTGLSAQGLKELASGGDGWGAPDVLQALTTITGPEQSNGGGKAPAFTLSATDGSSVASSSFEGTPVVINFWASYCPPCKAEMPLLEKEVGASKARLVLVDEGDSRESATAFLRGLGIHQAALLDLDSSVGRAYGLSALPMTIFVRADGTIDRRQVGQVDESVLAAELSNLGSQ